MKKSIAIVSFILILFGCNKDNSTSRQPSFKFKAKCFTKALVPGNEPVIKKLNLYSRQQNYHTSDLSNSEGSTFVNVFDVSITVDTLSAGEYSGTLYSNSAITRNAIINFFKPVIIVHLCSIFHYPNNQTCHNTQSTCC